MVRSFVGVRPFFLYCTTVQFCCTCAVDKKRKRGPRAQKGPRATGITRGTHPRAPQGREQRGTVLRTKPTAPEPRIVRAPELVLNGISFVVRGGGGRLFYVPTTTVNGISFVVRGGGGRLF